MNAARGSTLVAAGIFLSRIAGLIRNVVLGVVLGAQPAITDAFGFAMRLPNLLQNLLGEGSLSASFIPVYARLVEEKREREADDLAGAVVALLALVTGVIVVAAVLLARPLVWLFTNWEANPPKYELTITLTRITTIGIGFLVISAWCLGILNSHRSFFLSYVAPVIWNVTQIAVLVVFGLLNWALDDIAIAVAWAVVAGGLFQLMVQLPKVRRLAPTVRLNLTRTEARDDVLRRFAPALGARGVVQVSSYTDLVLATAFLVDGALSWYMFALPLYLLPISVFGFSVAASELAEMSRRSGNLEMVADRIKPALQRVLIPAGFVTAAYLAAAPVFVEALYGWPSRLFGREGLQDPARLSAIALVLMAFALGLPATMTARVTQNTLYSLGDVKGPARIAVVRLLVSAGAALVLILQFDWLTFDGDQVVQFDDVPHWPPWERVPEARRISDAVPHLGAVGLGLGASISAWVEWLLLRRLLRKTIGRPVRSGWGREVGVAGLAAAVVMFGVARLPIPSPLDAVAVGVAGVGVYAAALWIQGVRPTLSTGQGLTSNHD